LLITINNFISRRHDNGLNPLKLADTSLSEFSAELRNYLSIINEGGSIALGRGDDLASIGLSRGLESLFSTPTPLVREGPPLTWTSVVLFAGPRFDGAAQLKVGGSRVELPEIDYQLLLCKTAIQELVDTRKTISEVLEQISLVEQCLRNHRNLVSQLSGNKHPAVSRGWDLPFNSTGSSVSTHGVYSPHASAEDESSGYRPPSAHMTMHHASDERDDGLTEQINRELNDPAIPCVTTPGNSPQRDGLQPRNGTQPRPRLHTSNFIQSLSEILDDPENGEVMCWSEDGKSVSIAPESKCPANILTGILARKSTKSYQSLIRRLYYFGFRKIGEDVYYYDSYVRGQPNSIRPTREMSGSPSHPSPPRGRQSGPRYKIVKKRPRTSV
ncbi:hypothetical protein N7505_007767, partial [Penicillium chrysogenum]